MFIKTWIWKAYCFVFVLLHNMQSQQTLWLCSQWIISPLPNHPHVCHFGIQSLCSSNIIVYFSALSWSNFLSHTLRPLLRLYKTTGAVQTHRTAAAWSVKQVSMTPGQLRLIHSRFKEKKKQPDVSRPAKSQREVTPGSVYRTIHLNSSSVDRSALSEN